MSTLRRDGAVSGGGPPSAGSGPAPSGAESPAPAAVSSRRAGAAAGGGAAPASERAPNSYLEVDDTDCLPASAQGPRSVAPSTRRSPGGAPDAPASDRSPDSTLEIDERDWLAVSPPAPATAKGRPPRPAPTAPPPRKPSPSRPLVTYEPPPEGSELLHPGSDEVADSGVLSPASRRAPDPWATPSIAPPPPFGPSLSPVEVGPGAAAAPVEAETSASDGAGAVAIKAPPRAEPRPVPRWAFASVPLVIMAAFGLTRFLAEPVTVATPPDALEAPKPVEAIEPAAQATAATRPPAEPVDGPPPAASEEAPPAPASAEAAPAPPPAEAPKLERVASPAAGPKAGDERAPRAQPAAPAPAGTAFNRDAAATALGAALANAQRCVPGGMGGVARVAVTFAPSGRVTQATVEGPPFAGTPAGGCIARRARAASVPAFPGGPVTVHKSVRF